MATLYLIATPIGNLEDITHRAVRVLGEIDALACEDTRITRRIFERYGISLPATVFPYHEHNEEQAGKRILGLLANGSNVGLCTDGGCPGISDPGYRIIMACYEAGHAVEVLPGASAVTTALLLSGLPSSSYTFKGFPPRKPGPRKRFLELDRDLPHTLVIFESPYRLAALLADAHAVLGNRLAAVCIELTKRFERVHRGSLSELSVQFQKQEVRGEVTVVIAGNHPKFREESVEPEDEY
ncbi:MAG TPA: 16S rRNA (cytidine(1402)-2'-O)-methyltransferase [Candidatus Hydrogenedentes bacterium]|nr:16S rRNA (cytidine(1402)-2'-O)-methyltransferase [Candidatus Hydrogenedentota bacterium]